LAKGELSRHVPEVHADTTHDWADGSEVVMHDTPSFVAGLLTQLPLASHDCGLQNEPTTPDAAELHAVLTAMLLYLQKPVAVHLRVRHTCDTVPAVHELPVLNDVEHVPLWQRSVKHEPSLVDKPVEQAVVTGRYEQVPKALPVVVHSLVLHDLAAPTEVQLP